MRNQVLISLFLFFLGLAPGPVSGDEFRSEDCSQLFNTTPDLSAHFTQLSPAELEAQIAVRRTRVAEFRFIREEAKKRGIRVWLFGGTAAAMSHYVKWDLLRERGDVRYRLQRFDYDYTHIFRSSQDIDLVIDAGEREAEEFEEVLKKKFPYFLGSKASLWEVRSISQPQGDKGALLEDFGFMNQHTDSNSTGLVELTDPHSGQSVIRDLRDWSRDTESQFLVDVAQGQLTYYYSPRHSETPRAKSGQNPPIFSVIRALIKAFQYDLKIRPQDLEKFKKEVDHFDPADQGLKKRYVSDWIEKNGKKLFQHAMDLEYAWNTLEALGLRRKLSAIRNNPKMSDTLSWWMNKEPLRRNPSSGKATGRTARDLGIEIVSHETRDFISYESITRSHLGIPNVFISRSNHIGESATYGDGFYTSKGFKGGARTGIHIRFQVDPEAREGIDFILAYQRFSLDDTVVDGDFVIWRNKNSLRVIPESLSPSLSGYLQFLSEGKTLEPGDRAPQWRWKTRLEHAMASGLISEQELEKIRRLTLDELESGGPHLLIVLHQWMKLEGARLDLSEDEINHWFEVYQSGAYLMDPAPFSQIIHTLSAGTELESHFRNEWLPRLLAK